MEEQNNTPFNPPQPERPAEPEIKASKDPVSKMPFIVGLVILLIIGGTTAALIMTRKDKEASSDNLVAPNSVAEEPPKAPRLTTEALTDGFSNIWDMVFVESNIMVFDERGGKLHGLNTATKEKWEIGTVPNVRAESEGGLLGLVADNQFSDNRYLFACYNAGGSKRNVKVTRFKLAADNKSVSEFTDIVSDIQSQGGRHSGCRMAMDWNNVLWIGTGDSVIASAPQDPKSLAGKILRVDREGKAVEGNLSPPFDDRIYSYGHRNTQGIVLLKEKLSNGAVGLTAEHGTDRDDEINWLMPGNFGWDPSGNAYNETAPMTDKAKYQDAVEAVWSSGDPTLAISGITLLTNDKWDLWQGWLAVAVLKDKHVRLLEIKADGKVDGEEEILKDFGRIRTLVEDRNGNLYLSTDNGNGTDKIIRVTPSG